VAAGRQARLDRLFGHAAPFYDLQLPLEGPALRVAAAWAGSLRGLRVLDAGAGTGGLAGALVATGGPPAELVLLDRSPEMLRRAARRVAPVGPAVVLGDARRLPWREGRFELVGVSYLLHLLEPAGARAVLEEARRVLVPGGRLLVVHHVRAAGPRGRRRAELWRALGALAAAVVPASPSGSLAASVGGSGFEILRAREVVRGYRSEVILAARP
jgi:ubiquinone/menaquinone biosynthesis C-methylase UbiE